jgi:hypothetical protein
MSDIRVQYVSKDTSSSGTSIAALAPTDFSPVTPTSVLMLPVGSRMDTAGIGRVGGSASSAWRLWLLSADLSSDGNTLTFARDNDTSTGVARAAVQFIEYRGTAGGPNEFIRRHKETLTLASGSASVDSSAMSGFSDINRCVAQGFGRTDRNSNPIGESALKVDIVDVSGAKKVRVSRGSSTGTMTIVVYVTEFTGSNWSVQRVASTISSSDTNVDSTITAVDIAKSFVISTFQSAGGTPAHGTTWAYLSSATNLRQRCEQVSTTSMVSWVISNTQLSVQRLGTPDGVKDWLSSDTLPKAVTVTSVDSTTAATILQAGSDDTTAANNPVGLWSAKIASATSVQATRTDVIGDTESVLQVLDFSQVAFGPVVSSVTTIKDGATFSISGQNLKVGSTDPTITLGGVPQTIRASNATLISCLVVRGNMRYGAQPFVLTTSQGSVNRTENVGPAAGSAYVNLSTLASDFERITALPDLASGDQVSWNQATLATVANDGSFDADSGLISFDAEVNDGTGWGAPGTQILIAPDPPAPEGPFEFVIAIAP